MSLALTQLLAERIKLSGKITFRDWMEIALYHPELGYYNRTDLKRWGRDGDYRTSPERSLLFSSTVARYFANLYELLGQPDPLLIVEFGAGNGHFAAGLLDSFSREFANIYRKTSYAIVDRSLDSLRRCAQHLKLHGEHTQFLSLDQFGEASPAIVFSNELLDAFPVHRLKKVGGELKELYVDIVADQFTWVLDSPSTTELVRYFEDNIQQVVEGQTIEINFGIEDWLASIARNLTDGFVVTVDYGDEQARLYDPSIRFDGTLRAFRQHQFVDNLLEAPGDCDLTTTIDWEFVMKAGQRLGLEVETFERLDQFLLNSGLLSELETLLTTISSEAERSQLTTSAREMILPGGMASSFQILVQRRTLNER